MLRNHSLIDSKFQEGGTHCSVRRHRVPSAPYTGCGHAERMHGVINQLILANCPALDGPTEKPPANRETAQSQRGIWAKPGKAQRKKG